MEYTQEDINDFIKAGQIASQVKEFGAKLIKVDASMLEVLEACTQKTYDLGGRLAFPPQSSINDCAAHFAPRQENSPIYKEGDLVKLDVGIHINGFIGDTAITVDLGDNKVLTQTSKKALERAIKLMKPGRQLKEIGAEIEKTALDAGFLPIRNLSGHGIGKFIVHQDPSIPNFDNKDKTELQEGDTIACEPFVTDGAGMIYEAGEAELFTITGKKPVRSQYARELLKLVESKYDNLPFSTWLLQKDMSLPKINFALKELNNLDILKQYPPLMEKNKGMVAQFEHSMIITNNGCKVSTE